MSTLDDVMFRSAEEVLENMFFSGIAGPLTGPAEGNRLAATVTFRGSRSGSLCVSAAPATIAELAAGFLGAEGSTVTTAQTREVAGELANVLCGVILGRIDADGQFSIAPPAMEVFEGDGPILCMNLQQRFELPEGDLSIGLTVN